MSSYQSLADIASNRADGVDDPNLSSGKIYTYRYILFICDLFGAIGASLTPCLRCLYTLLTKCKGRTERISARALDRKKDLGLIFSQYGPKQAWLIRDLL